MYRLANEKVNATGGRPRGGSEIVSIIIHTTGGINGALLAAVKNSTKKNGTAVWSEVEQEYSRKLAKMPYKAHFLIGWTGKIFEYFDPGTMVAPHSGGRPNASKFKDPEYYNEYYDTNIIHPIWKNRWDGVLNADDPGRRPNPLDFPVWQAGNLNGNSIGIDLQGYYGSKSVLSSYNVPNGRMPAEQEAALIRLVNALCADYTIPRERLHIVGHSDVDPISRPGMADPAQYFPWHKLTNDADARSGRPKWSGDGPRIPSSKWNGRKNKVDGDERVGYIGGVISDSGNIPFNEFDYLTPEERRKGIIAKFFYLSDWHLNQLAPDGQGDPVNVDDGNYSKTPFSPNKENNNNGLRGDISTDPRRRYCMALVEAEYYRQKFASRSVPSVSGPFNPYPVAGFPGLILTPSRPIIGKIVSVTHSINIPGANATTTVSFSSPRYWDEGEVWYWYGGKERSDPIFKKAPQWINRYILPTNNFVGGSRTKSNLDKFYLYHIGCLSIEYISNHFNLDVTKERIENFTKTRTPWRWELNPDTLAIAEKNYAIGGEDEDGNLSNSSMMKTFLGISKATTDHPSVSTNINDATKYIERYGISEKQYFEDFLQNSYYKITDNSKRRLVVAGPTWENETSDDEIVLTPQQQLVLDYMNDIESRTLEIHD